MASGPIEALAFDAPGDASKASPAASDGAPRGDSLISASSAAYTAARQNSDRRWWHSQFNLMLAVFALLAVTAGLFVALAPPPEMRIATPAELETSSPQLTDSDAPWSQNQLTEARNKAQEILAKLLDGKKELEKMGVLDWAPDRYQQALDEATRGDELYKEQQFAQSLSAYQQAVDEMDSLYEFLPDLIARLLREGQQALRDGKSALAQESFQKALDLEPANLSASEGLDRAARLDDVLELMTEARTAQSLFADTGNLEDLQTARSKVEQALQIDNIYEPAQTQLAEIEEAITDKRFKMAMTRAYGALFANRYSQARREFAAALKIRPDDRSAAAALQQSLASDKSASIGSLLSSARQYEQNEEWASAASNYQTVLQRDPNQVSAKIGNLRSGARQQLDQQITKVLEDVLVLNRSENQERASAVLKDAQAIKTKGPRLLQQIATLESALNSADTPVKVRLLSDNLTSVTLRKIGSRPIELGQFAQKNLSLKPGRYVAVGVRLGYQDVRQEIELYPGESDIQPFTVRCEREIGQT